MSPSKKYTSTTATATSLNPFSGDESDFFSDFPLASKMLDDSTMSQQSNSSNRYATGQPSASSPSSSDLSKELKEGFRKLKNETIELSDKRRILVERERLLEEKLRAMDVEKQVFGVFWNT